jgi:serum/glucocorticoid-regulated kinase 2
MSWKTLARSGNKRSMVNLRAAEDSNAMQGVRPTTPTPGTFDGKPSPRSGLLAIRVLGAEGLVLPNSVSVPPAVQNALNSQQAKVAASVSPSSVNQQRLAAKHASRGNR